MSSPQKTHPPGVDARGVAKCSDGDRNSTNVTTTIALIDSALCFDRTAVEPASIHAIDRRRRAYFELQSFLRDAA